MIKNTVNGITENDELQDGYMKIDRYNKDKIDRIASCYTDIITDLVKTPNAKVF